MSNLAISSPIVTVALTSNPVMWAYLIFSLVFIVGLALIVVHGDWQTPRCLEKLILLGPLFYAAPLAAFGTEHFTFAGPVASLIPAWIPWHQFWVYFLGACFIAAAVSMITGIRAHLSASLLALNFFLFVVLMDAPAWAQNPRSRFALALMLRQLAFSGGALAFAASLGSWSKPLNRVTAMIARYFVAIPVLYYSFVQFMHGSYVPAIPLNRLTPDYIVGHNIWTYLSAIVYAAAGILLLIGKKTRIAAVSVGLVVLVVELVVYVPMAVVDRARIEGFNFMADTLMFCGAVLLLARAMPKDPDAEG